MMLVEPQIIDPSCDSEIRNRWFRDETGTYELLEKNGKLLQIRIANQLVKIVKILFIIAGTRPSIEYWVEFSGQGCNAQVRISHENLSDEKAFLTSAPAGFSLASGYGKYSLLRECLMSDLQHASRTAVLTALGWYLSKGTPVFAHAGGVCSANSPSSKDDVSNRGTFQSLDLIDIDAVCSNVPILAGTSKCISEIIVEVPPQFAKYVLPEPTSEEDKVLAIKLVLDLLLTGDCPAFYVGVASVIATIIRDPRYGIFLYGESGSLKTAFALLLLSFFVPNPQEEDCVSFSSTANALRGYFSISRNVAVIVDDFVPRNGYRQTAEEIKKIDDFLRSVVNGTGKDRCGSDGQLRTSPRPCGLAILTGEALPEGCESLKWRTINVPIDSTTFAPLTEEQRPNAFDRLQFIAANGTYAKAMRVFIEHIAGSLDKARYTQTKWTITSSFNIHRRLIDATHELIGSMAVFLDMATDIKACTPEIARKIHENAAGALYTIQRRAYLESLEDSPVERFFMILREALFTRRCHLELNDPNQYFSHVLPIECLGYSKIEFTAPSNQESSDSDKSEYSTITTCKPNGLLIGRYNPNGEYLDLIPSAALEVANNIAKTCGMATFPAAKQLGKLLASKKFLLKQSNDRNTYKIRLLGIVQDVWRFSSFHLFEYAVTSSGFQLACLEDSIEEERITHYKRFVNSIRTQINDKTRKGGDELLNPKLDPATEYLKTKPEPIVPEECSQRVRTIEPIKPPYVSGWSEFDPEEEIDS